MQPFEAGRRKTRADYACKQQVRDTELSCLFWTESRLILNAACQTVQKTQYHIHRLMPRWSSEQRCLEMCKSSLSNVIRWNEKMVVFFFIAYNMWNTAMKYSIAKPRCSNIYLIKCLKTIIKKYLITHCKINEISFSLL